MDNTQARWNNSAGREGAGYARRLRRPGRRTRRRTAIPSCRLGCAGIALSLELGSAMAPTYAENGFPDFYAASWVGFFVPSKADDAIIGMNPGR